MRNVDSLAPFLGIQTIQTTYGVLHQKQYAKRILECAGMQNSKFVFTPISCKTDNSTRCSTDFSNPQLYRHLIGSLQYLTLTYHVIQFMVHQLSQDMHAPLNSNFDALKRLLRYIQGTTNNGIPLHRDHLNLQGFVDANWANNAQDQKSISRYYNFLGKSLIFRQVKKQSTVARSSTKSEYRALATEASEVFWLCRLLEDFHIPQLTHTIIYCDNTFAIALANNPGISNRTLFEHRSLPERPIEEFLKIYEFFAHKVIRVQLYIKSMRNYSLRTSNRLEANQNRSRHPVHSCDIQHKGGIEHFDSPPDNGICIRRE
ncbi:uncharacterized protein LOC110108721 [Dendrobium catenatum]|uniref:uncharacterized protein LOC110108721 n=1 Tax=Dendrobium catenatum TaxID=906689 RepID=UPI0009F469A4|nr:uncharacterized protein LOC110108721 [Dendrobium catenatum]